MKEKGTGFGRNQTRVATAEFLECCSCFSMKYYYDFHKDKHSATGRTYYCKSCANQKARISHSRRKEEVPGFKEYQRNRYIRSTYGISAKEYDAMLEAQGFSCAICKVKLLPRGHGTHLDHSHKTGKLRAMLCTNCNRGLGHFKENVEFLRNAITYLHSHNGDVASIKEVCHDDCSH